jgi:site-specific DNA recombinase
MKPTASRTELRAAVYSRFSTDRQSDSSIADQVRVCTEYAQRQGWQITHHFEDQGISGTAMGNRPGVLSMRETALAGRFDVLLVTDLNRLARSEDLPPLISRLRFHGVRIIGIHDGFDSAARTARMQAGMSAIMGGEFIEMVRARTYAALETRAKDKRPTGGRAYGYRGGKVDAGEALIVREIFSRFADDASCRRIAAELNARGVPSPGSSWKRETRRASGWMASTIRVIVRNERYRGVVRWNTSEWRKDPDSGKRLPRARPASEWITHTNETLRIVSDELFSRAQQCFRQRRDGDARLKAGGKPRYSLSGLLVCSMCKAHYILADGRAYGCSGYLNGRACANGVRVRRDALEDTIIGPVRERLRNPVLVAQMGRELEAKYKQHLQQTEARAQAAPRELQEIDARLLRLRARQAAGDPDMAADEIQAAIDKAEAKRQALTTNLPEGKQRARVLSMLPKAAALYLRQIDQGLDGDPRAALKSRIILREMLGPISLEPGKGGSLWANFKFNPAALVKAAGTVVAGAGFEPATFGL